MNHTPRWYDSLFILLFVYLFILQLQAIWSFTIDDMYISLRYAKNWAAGYGVLWNIDAPPVEGYSNFSFVALAALTLLLGGDPVLVLKIAGIVGLFFSTYFVYLISRYWFARRESLLPCLALLLYKGQIIWAVAGLETTVYEALVCGSVYFCLRGMGYQLAPDARGKTQPVFFILSALLLSLAGMTRPEAPALMLLLFFLICWDRPKIELKQYGYGVLLFVLTIGCIFIPYFSWRFYYFGYLFPNSVYCKGFANILTLALDKAYLKLIWPFLLLAIPACVRASDKRHYFLWTPSFVYLLMLVDADPIVAFDNRLFLPAFALLLPLTAQGLSRLLLGYLKEKDQIYFFLFYFLFSCFALLFIPKMTLAGYRYFSENPVKGEQLRRHVLTWLDTHTRAGDKIVLADSGMIPYFSHLDFIDSYCLNNLAMAHDDSAEQRYEHFCQDILPQKPEVIILTSLLEQGRVIYTPSDRCLQKVLNHGHEYTLSQTFSSSDTHSIYRYEIYRR